MGIETVKNDNQPDENAVNDTTAFNDDDIRKITDALHDGEVSQVQDLIADISAAESAELLEKIIPEDRETLVTEYLDEFDATTFVEMGDDLRKTILEKMDVITVANIVSNLDSDDAVDMLYNLDPVFQKTIIQKLSAKNRVTVEEGLTFGEDSAGRLMQREFVAIPQFWTVGKTIDYLRAMGEDLPQDFFDLFIIDPSYHILGTVPLNKLVRSVRSEKIDVLIGEQDLHIIPATMDQEDVARIFRREALVSAPVTDETNRLIGVITVDDIVDVITEEAEEDILRLAGVGNNATDIYHDVLNTMIIGMFDATIEQIVALAVLMPIVASMGGNAGTQTLTIAVRALATKELSRTNMARMIGKETLVGLINGLAFAVIAAFITLFWFEQPVLAVIIAIAMIINLITAGLFGIGIPVLLNSIGIDPALASSVFLTTITDIVGFFAFLGLAALVMT
jgi:magnesium transporter